MTDTQQQTAAAPSAIEGLKARIAELERKLGTWGERREFNRRARAEHGPPVNTTDSKALGDLRGEALRLELEEQDMRAWLAQARADLAEAERAEVTAGDIALARKRLELADLLRRGGAALTEAFSPERFENWCALIQALGATRMSHENAAPPPTLQQLRVFSVLAIKTMLQGVPLIAREFESVQPSHRTSFGKISSDWALSSERSARAFLEGAGVKLVAAE
jgi:hypothetical protein